MAHAVPTAPDTPGTGRTLVDVPALHDADRLTSLLLAAGSRAARPEDLWLHRRYVELVPELVPGLLSCLRTGEPLPRASLEAVAHSAHGLRGSTVPYATVLRGGAPALIAFARFLRESDPRPTPHQTAVILVRAALIAQELGAHWVENWRGVRPPARAAGPDASRVGAGAGAGAIEVRPGSLASPQLEMVRMVAEGRSNEQIAAQTSYSPQAVKWHLARLMREWGVGNRAALVTGAFTRGVLRVRSPDRGRATDR